MKRWSISLMMVGLLAVVLSSGAVMAAMSLETYPQINDQGVVVWQGWDGYHYQIYHWDPKTTAIKKISDPNIDNQIPKINPKGLVVWGGAYVSGHTQIFLWDPKSQTTEMISQTNSNHDNDEPQFNSKG